MLGINASSMDDLIVGEEQMIIAESKSTGNPLQLQRFRPMDLGDIEHIISENSIESSPRNSFRNFENYSGLKANSLSPLLSSNLYNNFGTNRETFDTTVVEDKNDGVKLNFYASTGSNKDNDAKNFNENDKIINVEYTNIANTNDIALPRNEIHEEHVMEKKNSKSFLSSNYLAYNELSLEDTEE